VAGSGLWGVLFTASSFGQQPGSACHSRRLRDTLRAILSAGPIKAARRLWLGAALLISAAASAQGAEPASAPFELRAEGSLPLQYIDTLKGGTNQQVLSAAPYLGLSARTELPSDLSTAVFINGGHPQLGSFRDNDNTFWSGGGNLVKHWSAALSTGLSIEHTQYYNGSFGVATNTANDVNVFARYDWKPNPDLRVRPSVMATMRLDDALAVQRYTYSARVDVEQRLFDRLWFVVSPGVRYYDYVGTEAGRRDTRAAIVGGLRYMFNDSVSAQVLAGVEDRQSNVASKSSDKYIFGASLDFDVDLTRPRWLAGR
jgi:hypothetical protein